MAVSARPSPVAIHRGGRKEEGPKVLFNKKSNRGQEIKISKSYLALHPFDGFRPRLLAACVDEDEVCVVLLHFAMVPDKGSGSGRAALKRFWGFRTYRPEK